MAVVRIAFVICLPTKLAKKKVYNAAIKGLTVVNTRPTRNLRAPVSNINTSRPSNTTGA